jgi:hypothetical protein
MRKWKLKEHCKKPTKQSSFFHRNQIDELSQTKEKVR